MCLDDDDKATFGNKDGDIDWVNDVEKYYDWDNKGNSVTWLDADEITSWNAIRGKITDIDYQIWEYETNADGDLYSLTGRYTRYATDVDINNGESYVDTTSTIDDIVIDQNTIIVDVENNVAYTGYDAVPDISNAKIAYVVENDRNGSGHEVAEIIYVIEGDIYDSDAMYFVITSSDRDTEKYDGDKYFEFDDMYVDGRRTSGLYVAYDALTDEGIATTDDGIDDGMVGKVFKVMKSIDNTYITDIELVNDWNYVDVATSSALNLYDGKTTAVNGEKYTTNSDTIYVMIEETWARTGDWWLGWELTYNVDPAGYRDILEDGARDDDGYYTLAQVVKADGKTAELVYILYTNSTDASEPDQRSIAVRDGDHATVSRTSAAVNETVTVTVAPEAGYSITGVSCSAASSISNSNGIYTVTIPAGTSNVVIAVNTEAHEYDVTCTGNQYWDVKIVDENGDEVTKVVQDQQYTVTATAKVTNVNQNGAATIALNGTKTDAVAEGGVVAEYNTIDAATAKAVMAMNGTVYTFDGPYTYTEFTGTPSDGTTYYTVKVPGVPAVATYTFTADSTIGTYNFTVMG